jgi:superoxide reductase
MILDKYMTELNQVYKCNVCGNIVEMVHAGAGELVCCGEPMALQSENTVDASLEKHVPVIEILSEDKERGLRNIKVKIGAAPHPMEEKHFIEWIEVYMVDAGRVGKKYLKPGDKPEAEFHVRAGAVEVRAYCNLHGLWKTTV